MSHFPGHKIILDASTSLHEIREQVLPSQGAASLNLLASLEYPISSPPLAALLKAYHQLEGEWVIASPIHWEATHNDAQIVAFGETLDVQEYDFQSYAQYLSEAGHTLFYHSPTIWLLRVDGAPPLHAKSVYQLLGKPLMPELLQLDYSMYWQKYITESQMFFAAKMQDRAINGVWLWGNAPLSPKTTAICADATCYPLAQHAQAPVTLYTPELSLKRFPILLIKDLDSLSEAHKKQLKGMHSAYYWNNMAYINSKPHFLQQLWSYLFHAY